MSVLVSRAPDLPGQWIAHCLDLDLVTQGTSIEDALRMAKEMIHLTVEDDVERGLDPFERPMAPDEDWDRMLRVLRRGRSASTLTPSERTRLRVVVARLTLRIPAGRGAAAETTWEPAAWNVAELAA